MRAYHNAASTIRASPRRLADMVAEGEDLSQLQGVGSSIAKKIAEMVETGHLAALEKLEQEEGAELPELLRIPGLGPKRVRKLHDALGVTTMAELAKAARQGRVAELPGFGARTQSAILAALTRGRPDQGRLLWVEAEPIAESLVGFLGGIRGVEDAAAAGSFRRRRETVGDLDLLVSCEDGERVLERFAAHEDVQRVVSLGTTRASVVLRTGLEVDARAVPPESFGAALHYFTGSKAHNVAVRRLGQKRGLKINEYGVFRGRRRVGGRTEKEVFAGVGLPYIEPELREDRGELEAAREGTLPRLLAPGDIRGDLHVHTDASDGRASLAAMARAARSRGYEYLAITDHTQSLRVARGLDPRRLRGQLRAIDRLNEKLEGITLLKGAEVDVLQDGSLDLPDDLLDELDLCIGAVHSHLELSGRKQTERILRAMDHPRFQALAHPTGRLIGSRDAYAVDVERIIEGAAERGCWLELNAQPRRLDLSDVWLRAARERGVPISVATDAHAPEQLDLMRLGVGQARRGWLEKRDVVNTRSLAGVRRLLRRS